MYRGSSVVYLGTPTLSWGLLVPRCGGLGLRIRVRKGAASPGVYVAVQKLLNPKPQTLNPKAIQDLVWFFLVAEGPDLGFIERAAAIQSIKGQ